MTHSSQILTMGEDALKITNARAVTATGKPAYAWEGVKIKLVIKFQIVMLVFTVSTTLTRLFLHVNHSLREGQAAMMTWIARIQWDAQELI
jgi:hypothetical protein